MTMRRESVCRALPPLAVGVLLAVLAAPVSASASEVLVYRDGKVTTATDPLLPPPAAEELSPTPAAGPDPEARNAHSEPEAHVAQTGTVKQVLAESLAAGLITQADFDSYNAIWDEGVATRDRLGGRCAKQLGKVLSHADRIAQGGQLSASRMPAIFLTVRRNTQFWASRPNVAPGQRVAFPPAQMVFQHYAGQGIQIQPLGNFGKANGLWGECVGRFGAKKQRKCKAEELRQLLDELVAVRGERAGFAAWEYYFDFLGGRPPWISGMAQATAIQALARGSQFLGEPAYMEPASSALGAFEQSSPIGVLVRSAGGNHYLLYSFARRLRVLNGFLQAVIGLHDYAQISGDPRAQSLFAAGDRAARREVPRYDTGKWSYYALPNRDLAPYGYQQLVTTFLRRMCRLTGARVYCRHAARFSRYLRKPQTKPGAGAPRKRCGY